MRIISRTQTASPDPVTVDDLADHLRIEATEAASAMRLAKVAAAEIERYAAVALFTQTIVVEFTAEEAATGRLPLPVQPFDAASAPTLATFNPDRTSQSFTDFALAAGHAVDVLLLTAPGLPVQVTYQAGYGSTAGDLPSDLTHALLDHALRLYDRRGDIDTMAGLAPSTARIAARYRRVSMGAA